MGILVRMFAAFCVASIIAQAIILGLATARGNLRYSTVMKGVALLNGIDVSADRLSKMMEDSKQAPIPNYEDVVEARALLSKDLQMKLESIRREQELVDKSFIDLKSERDDFDRRRDEFYNKVDEMEKNLIDESLKEVQRIIELLSSEQAKDQLLRLLAADQKNDVVAIVKVMSPDKRKKILGEFTEEDEANDLHEILMSVLAGEPTSQLIQDARENQTQTP